jgi:hypothetical protein
MATRGVARDGAILACAFGGEEGRWSRSPRAPLRLCVGGGSEQIHTTLGDVIESLPKQSLVDSEALHHQLGANAPAQR